MRKLSLLSFAVLVACSSREGSTPTADAGVVSSPVQRASRTTTVEQATAAFAEASAIAGRGEEWLGATLARNEEGLRLDGAKFLTNGRAGEGIVEGDIDVTASVDASDGLDLSLGQIARFRTHITPVNATAVRAAMAGTRVAWSSIYPSTDAMLVVGARFAEWAYLLRDSQAPRHFEFATVLPRSIKGAHLDGGDLLFDDAEGIAVFRVRAPFVVDATGTKRFAKLAWLGDRFTIDIDPSGLVYPLVLDPTLDIPVWQRMATTNPTYPEGIAVVNAPTAASYWLLNGSTASNVYRSGGYTYSPTSSVDTLDPIPGVIPSARKYAGAAVDLDGRTTVFGGYNATGYLNTYAVYDGTWTSNTSSVVSARAGVGMASFEAVDSGGTRQSYGALMFGGINTFTTYSTAYYRTTGDFIAMSTGTTTPLSRAYMAMETGGKNLAVVAAGLRYSGTTPVRLNDSWALAISDTGTKVPTAVWTQLCGTGSSRACGFSARSGPASAYDKARKRMIMFGGDSGSGRLSDLWEANIYASKDVTTISWAGLCGGTLPPCGTTVTPITGRSFAAMSCNAEGSKTRCYLFGGINSAGDGITETWQYYVRGSACTTNLDCDTGSCQDGACCESTSACGTCRACNVTGSIGQCANVASGQPHSTCAGPANVCNGAGICKKTAGQACSAGTDCFTGFCADGYCCDTACGGSCDVCATAKGATANGKCTILPAGSPGDKPCTPNVCSGSSPVCPGGCKVDTDCSAGSYCSADGKCTDRKVLGAACNPAADCLGGTDCRVCASNFCVDGVCCDRACDGLCEACSKTRKGTTTDNGLCGFAASGVPDRKGGCADTGTGDDGCKTDGFCGGAGSCRIYSATTSCGAAPATCVGNSASGKFCNGTGTCTASGTAKDCAPFKCVEGSGCPSTCTSDANCVSTAYCKGGVCTPKQTIGLACTEARECDSGLCIDGNCCERPCDGQCEACDVKGAEGKCAPVIGAPHSARPSCGTAPEGKPCEAPACDGTVRDKCLGRPGADVKCQDKSCTDGVEKPAAVCDGKGTCAASDPRPCGAYACALDACKSTCTSNADCAAPNTCDTASGKCVASGKCDADGFTAISADGTTKRDCRPYRCDATGICIGACTTSGECVAPNVCDTASKTCVPPAAGDTGDDGGCSAGRSRNTIGGAFLLVAALGVIARRRRRG